MGATMMLSTLGVLCYPAAIVAFVFVTLSLASGLLYVAEVIEEYSRTAKLIGQRTTYAIMLLAALCCADGTIPIWLTMLNLTSHAVYLQNFSKTWPLISPQYPASPMYTASTSPWGSPIGRGSPPIKTGGCQQEPSAYHPPAQHDAPSNSTSGLVNHAKRRYAAEPVGETAVRTTGRHQ